MNKPNLCILGGRNPGRFGDCVQTAAYLKQELGDRVDQVIYRPYGAYDCTRDELVELTVLGKQPQSTASSWRQVKADIYVGIKTLSYEGMKILGNSETLGEQGYQLAASEGIPSILLDEFASGLIVAFAKKHTTP